MTGWACTPAMASGAATGTPVEANYGISRKLASPRPRAADLAVVLVTVVSLTFDLAAVGRLG